ncbi:MAG: hypothetical protein JW982_07640 [Spirochaetes bacterium]|nr:hypothetical protein [Spirochaetota bacterium]
MYSTTLNIRLDVYKQLKQLSLEYEISVTYLIQKILKQTGKNLKINFMRNDSTHYQDKQPEKSNWKCFHIVFPNDEFNQNLQFRYKYRISLSKLLFIGFVLFIGKVLAQLENKGENNKFQYNYTSNIIIYWHLIKKELEIFIMRPKKPKN